MPRKRDRPARYRFVMKKMKTIEEVEAFYRGMKLDERPVDDWIVYNRDQSFMGRDEGAYDSKLLTRYDRGKKNWDTEMTIEECSWYRTHYDKKWNNEE